MNACPQCKKTYENERQKFCTDDGATLIALPDGVSVDSIAGTAPIGGHHPFAITDAVFPPRVDPLAEGSTSVRHSYHHRRRCSQVDRQRRLASQQPRVSGPGAPATRNHWR